MRMRMCGWRSLRRSKESISIKAHTFVNPKRKGRVVAEYGMDLAEMAPKNYPPCWVAQKIGAVTSDNVNISTTMYWKLEVDFFTSECNISDVFVRVQSAAGREEARSQSYVNEILGHSDLCSHR
jgi:hypothetical protein